MQGRNEKAEAKRTVAFEPWRCRHPDCEYHARKGEPNGCDYLTITGHSRIKGLSEEEAWPCNCKKYKPRDGKARPAVGEREKPWHAACLRLHEAGRTTREIGDALNMCPTTIRAFLKRMGLKPNRNDMKNLDWELAMRLYLAGAPDRAIAREIGCSGAAVCRWRKKQGLVPNASEEKWGRETIGKCESV